MSYHLKRYNHPNQDWLEVVLSLRAEFGDKDSPEPFASFIKSRLEDENMLLVLAWVDEAPVGYGLAFDVTEHPFMPEWTRAGYVTQFLVSRSYRQRGIGKALMDYINDWFQSRGIQKVLLNVDIENEAGIRFWESQGFEAYAMRMRRIQNIRSMSLSRRTSGRCEEARKGDEESPHDIRDSSFAHLPWRAVPGTNAHSE